MFVKKMPNSDNGYDLTDTKKSEEKKAGTILRTCFFSCV